MGTHFISEDEHDDFMAEEDTGQWLPLLSVQRQLDAATSVARVTDLARRLAPAPVAEGHWTDTATEAPEEEACECR